jgi:single-stranded-DNA-specific exonuclease
LYYRWKFKEKPNEETVHNLARSLKIPKTLGRVLVGRGINTPEDANKFFIPSKQNIHSPFLMKDMEKAVDRVIKAKNDNESIWIHGDYDVDGTCSTAALYKFLQKIGCKVQFFIPDRFQDGYGLSERSLKGALEFGASLLISVDVGITALPISKDIKASGLDLIICDHHEPLETLPEAYAILDPIRKECEYPFKNLSACGVVFKLIQGISQKLGTPDKAYEYLDFVAMAAAADMVPLIGENRTLVYYGLKKLNEKTRPGLKGLIHCTNLKIGSITATNIVFAVAPIINAAGRMGEATRSVNMMIQDDEIHAFQIAQQLEDENRRRRLIDQQTFEEAIPLAEKQIKEGSKCLVIHQPHWHAGVIGIVASRLVDRFNVPTILMTTILGNAKGSCRSPNNFDIYSALKRAGHLLIEYGGHRHAAGLSLDEANIPELRRIINACADETISTDMLTHEIEIDSELKLNELSPNFISSLNKFAPYGYGNYKPIFFSQGVSSSNGVKIVGQNNLKFRAFQNNFAIDAIAFGLSHKYDVVNSGNPFKILYNLEINTFNGQNTPQLFIRDIKPED